MKREGPGAMKVLLVQPPSVPEWSRHVFAFEPLALEYIGAGLKLDGHTVRVSDARFDSGVEETFREMQPDAVGLTALTVHVPWVRHMAARFKAIDPRVFMVVGGHHATVEPQHQAARILRDPGILLYGSLIVEPDLLCDDFRELAQFVRKLDLRYVSFSVLTPFPGTSLQAEREKEPLTGKQELFDMLHALLPTQLPLNEFYSEFAGLHERALPLHRRLGILGKYGLKRAVSVLLRTPRVMAAIRNGHMELRESV